MNLGGNLEEIHFLKYISKFRVSVVPGLHKSHPWCEYLMKKTHYFCKLALSGSIILIFALTL